MNNAKLKLIVSVFSRRIAAGKTFEEVAESYPKLTTEDLEQIRNALNQ